MTHLLAINLSLTFSAVHALFAMGTMEAQIPNYQTKYEVEVISFKVKNYYTYISHFFRVPPNVWYHHVLGLLYPLCIHSIQQCRNCTHRVLVMHLYSIHQLPLVILVILGVLYYIHQPQVMLGVHY